MSRISGPGDRPIATSEPTTEAQQTSETESIQKTDISGKAPFDAEETANYHTPSTDTKSQQHESRLGGLARQTELQSLLPKHSEPVLKDLPGKQNLDPNVHLDEKIDVTKNLPDGRAINTGLKGLDWGSSKAKTGPNHMGVDVTYGGMKAPADRIAEVLNDGKLGQPSTSAPPKGGGSTVSSSDKSVEGGGIKSNPSDGPGSTTSEGKGGPSGFSDGKGGTAPPGAELGSRAPKWDLVGAGDGPKLKEYVPPEPKDTSAASEVGKFIYDNTMGRLTGKKWDDSMGIPDKTKKYTDPDAGGGTGGVPTSDEIAKIMKGRLGQAEHGINPDLGVGGPVTYGDFKEPIDPLSDPTDDGDSSVETLTPEKAKLAADIHGPRTLNPDSGFGQVKPEGGGEPGDPRDS